MLMMGCGVGGGEENEPIVPNPLAIACTDAFKISGTFTPSTARPVDNPATPDVNEGVEGCWPAGTWTFSVTLDPVDDNVLDVTGDKLPDRCGRVAGTMPATFKQSYSFIVTRTDNGEGYADSYAMNGGGFAADCSQAGDCIARLKVSEGGALECEGGLEIYSADRKMHWNFKPEQETGQSALVGSGEFTQYNEPQVL